MIQVSIIIVVYNAGEYLEKCLNSVFCQTYKGCIECILVNDCSTDNSIDIASNLLSTYNGSIKFRIINHRSNKGAAAARNTGIKEAKGKWIYFLDQDDWLIPQCIELMVASATKYPQSQVVFAGANATSGNYDWLDYENKNLPEYSDDQSWLQVSMLKRIVFGMTAWNKLVLRDFVLNNTIFFVEGLVHEDEAWNFEMSKFIKSASFVNINTYYYNVHSDSLVHRTTEDIRWKRLFALWNVLIKKIGGKRVQLQIRAITSHIQYYTQCKFPFGYRRELCLLFLRLSIKSFSDLSILLFLKGLLALLAPLKYSCRITARIGL